MIQNEAVYIIVRISIVLLIPPHLFTNSVPSIVAKINEDRYLTIYSQIAHALIYKKMLNMRCALIFLLSMNFLGG